MSAGNIPIFSPVEPEWFADVVVPLFLPKTLTWQVPPGWEKDLAPGIRVEVQLGAKKRYAGIVKKLHRDPPPFDTKPLLTILDERPIVPEAQLQLWSWMANYYMCSEGEVMLAALPNHLKLSSETILQFNENHGSELTTLGDREYLLAEALEIKQTLKLSEAQKILDSSHVLPVVKRLLEKGVCTAWENMQEKYHEKMETYVLLHPNYHSEAALEALLNSWQKAPKQMDLLLAFLHYSKTEGEVTRSRLLKKANTAATVLDGLVKKEVLLLEKRAVDRLPAMARQLNMCFSLSELQAAALAHIRTVWQSQTTCLLHGITGSGKTMLYLELIAEVIKKGEQCLYLLPEIALTAQIIRKLQQYLGGYVAVYHSKFNPNERVELWQKTASGEVQVILGSRSAVFLPFQKLSLIIVDEEHDSSYKQQEPPPRYHARDTAIYLAHSIGAKVLLGSATPALETYYNAMQGKYGLVTLTERFGQAGLPAIEWIDLKTYPPAERKGMVVSPAMQAAMQAVLAAGKQIIVFQNRRGYTPYQVCTTCGWIPKCEQCDVSLTYHKSTNRLMCHYCGTGYPVVKTCVQCGKQDFQQRNFGTEQLQEILDTLLPDATVGRMDTDSVKGKHSHDHIIRQFEDGKIQVLTGTQMVVKGLDFDNVGMVGIPDADGILHFSDFRVNERAFQLIEQVSGRAGRKDEAGRVLIQLNDTAHPLLPYLQQHDYVGFYKWEIENRKLFEYPPFTRLILLKTRHRDKTTSRRAMEYLCSYLSTYYVNYLIGPAEPPIGRVRNLYIWECMLKLPAQAALLQAAKSHIKNAVSLMTAQDHFKRVWVQVDVDVI